MMMVLKKCIFCWFDYQCSKCRKIKVSRRLRFF